MSRYGLLHVVGRREAKTADQWSPKHERDVGSQFAIVTSWAGLPPFDCSRLPFGPANARIQVQPSEAALLVLSTSFPGRRLVASASCAAAIRASG